MPSPTGSVDLWATVAAARGVDDDRRFAGNGPGDDRAGHANEKSVGTRTLAGLGYITIAISLHLLVKRLWPT